jgi:hypothetical protein
MSRGEKPLPPPEWEVITSDLKEGWKEALAYAKELKRKALEKSRLEARKRQELASMSARDRKAIARGFKQTQTERNVREIERLKSLLGNRKKFLPDKLRKKLKAELAQLEADMA